MNYQSLTFSVAILLLVGVPHAPVDAQRFQRCPPMCAPQSYVNRAPQMRVTYGGKIYFDFGTYTVAARGAPLYPGSQWRSTSRVIANDGRGMYWDGSGYFVHPAYRYDLVAKHNFTERTIGEMTTSGSVVTSRPQPPTVRYAPGSSEIRPATTTLRYLPPPIPPKLLEKQRELSQKSTPPKTRARTTTSSPAKK